jgi:hypothetical protein
MGNKTEWIDQFPNQVLAGDGFYISYNETTIIFGSFFSSDDVGPETALCYNGRFDILNGDFREAYERLVPEGLEACKRFYQQQSAHFASKWTT